MRSTNVAPLGMLSLWGLISMSWWALAFWPVNNNTEWLARTQYVCFGKLPGQLLPLSGWILLFGAPVLLLFSMLIVYRSEIEDSFKQIFKSRILVTITAFLTLAFCLEVVWVGYRIKQEKSLSQVAFVQNNSGHLPLEYPVGKAILPDFNLVDQFGKKISPENLRGHPVVFSFVFAHCKAVCPTLVKQVTGAMKKLENTDVVGALVTLDPWRDRPSSLASIAHEWELEPNIHFLSGSVKDVVKLHKEFKLPLERNDKTGDVAHPSLVYIISPEGKIAYTFNNPPVQWIVDAINKVKVR